MQDHAKIFGDLFMKRMLFNATHSEELRVATVDGQKLVNFDIEVAGKEQKKGNIYKGVVTRIEPSLEACFVNYGEERHGFLPFKEISRELLNQHATQKADFKVKNPLNEGAEILVQVEKEERGNKGAALTTLISLAGRYLVLMPNNSKGGGISRRIEGEERQELKEVLAKLNCPGGMSLIARTAGIGRNVEELNWDLAYLLQLWNAISGAKALQPGAFLIYQESSLVIRAIRDYFNPDVGEVLIDTDQIFEQAHQFMQHVMPDMEPRVKRYSDVVPLYSRFQIEHQIETAYSRVVQLSLGGSIVIDHSEALVAIDVNSARATKGADIEETAFRTNIDAAEEIGRQLRLRDLGGLIVIDFIDMELAKNQREVEQKLKDALAIDRARVQMGKISRFGLMELSRQRLKPALNEGSHITCKRCNGIGVIRDINSSALHILRIIQDEAMKDGTSAIHVQVPIEVATFLLNEKRGDLTTLEARLKVTLVLIPNKYLETPNYKIDRLKYDEQKNDENTPSYELTENFAKENRGYNDNTSLRENQKAIIKGISPAKPAPRSNKEKKKFTFFKVLKSLFSRVLGTSNKNSKAGANTRKRVNKRFNKGVKQSLHKRDTRVKDARKVAKPEYSINSNNKEKSDRHKKKINEDSKKQAESARASHVQKAKENIKENDGRSQRNDAEKTKRKKKKQSQKFDNKLVDKASLEVSVKSEVPNSEPVGSASVEKDKDIPSPTITHDEKVSVEIQKTNSSGAKKKEGNSYNRQDKSVRQVKPINTSELQETIKSAGLNWVETDPVKKATNLAGAGQKKSLGRVMARKNGEKDRGEDNLILVETKNRQNEN
tara:strand:- start:8752 stop:11250 length:2499 start_codon:yes stop_codon:yes gene_type:complete